MHDLLYIGEFVPAWALHEQPRMQVSEQWIQDNLRTPANPKGALYKGTICCVQSLPTPGSEEKQSIDMDAALAGTPIGAAMAAASSSSAAGPSAAGCAIASSSPAIAGDDVRHVCFIVRFNEGETSAWQCGIRTTANVLYAFCVRVLRLAPEIVGDAEDTYEEVFRALSPPFHITSARRLSGVKASERASKASGSAEKSATA